MLGWKQRYIPPTKPSILPYCLTSPWWKDVDAKLLFTALPHKKNFFWSRYLPLLLCFVFSYIISLGARLLETPFWAHSDYFFNGEFLLATHDAYHWVAGAEGFEFGVGHPMSIFLAFASKLSGVSPANLGFWLPPFISSFVATSLCFWAYGLGRPYSGLCAGVMASLSPAFFARTQLGFYDTDFVVMLFAILIGLVPALWLTPWLKTLPDFIAELFVRWKNKKDFTSKNDIPPYATNAIFSVFTLFLEKIALSIRKKAFTPTLDIPTMEKAMLSWPWLFALSFSGVFGYWSQEWHSFFPYYIRFSALLIPFLIFIAGPLQGRVILLRGALCYAFPLFLGGYGFILSLLLSALFHVTISARSTYSNDNFLIKEKKSFFEEMVAHSIFFLIRLVKDHRCIYALWGIILLLCLDLTTLNQMLTSFVSYAQRGGDLASHATGADPLIFPSVSESIIETQTVSFSQLLQYFYPSKTIVFLSIVAVLIRMVKTPVLLWFFPFLLLFFLSHIMGARMTMFGPPMLALCLCLEGGCLLQSLAKMCRDKLQKILLENNFSFVSYLPNLSVNYQKWGFLCTSLICTLWLIWPLVMVIPYQSSNGPIISKEQAQALSVIEKETPPESIVWNWWDWGYATQHFSMRTTIADGARHGGPSLYLPAAVYTTSDPRFARQTIKYTARKNNIPGEVFKGLTASQAQDLMVELGDKKKPLIQAPGKQYLVVSYDIVTIGAWISTYGSWNFIKKEMHPSLLNGISGGDINFNSESGIILYNTEKERHSVQAGSVSIFSPHQLQRFLYQPRGKTTPPYNRHFIFDVKNRTTRASEKLKKTFSYKFWDWRLGSVPLYSAVSNKLLMDSLFYNTMMVQLLVSSKDDPRFTPYFKCIFDNIYCRVYEVL